MIDLNSGLTSQMLLYLIECIRLLVGELADVHLTGQVTGKVLQFFPIHQRRVDIYQVVTVRHLVHFALSTLESDDMTAVNG